MVLKIETRKLLHTSSERVKCTVFHPTEKWLMCCLYNGYVILYDITTQSSVRSFEVSTQPLRAGCFIVREQCIAIGGDDTQIRIYNYNTLERMVVLEGHTDYIRKLKLDPTEKYLLSASDDKCIIAWRIDKNYQNVCRFEGHTHYVMDIAWCGNQRMIFATASLDKSIMVWTLPDEAVESTRPNYSLLGHTRGVNTVSYMGHFGKSHIVSGGDDHSIRIWDILTKNCLHVLHGHVDNVTGMLTVNTIPVLITCGEDGGLNFWNSNTFRLIHKIENNLGRAWSLCLNQQEDNIAIGYDEGSIVLKLGLPKNLVTLCKEKLYRCQAQEVQTTNIKQEHMAGKHGFIKFDKPFRSLGLTDFYPSHINHHPNGRYISLQGGEEYAILTTLELRAKQYGDAQALCWSTEGDYATLYKSKISIYSDFEKTVEFHVDSNVSNLFGGVLLGASTEQSISFYDWKTGDHVASVELSPSHVYWNEEQTKLVFILDNILYVFDYLGNCYNSSLHRDTNQKNQAAFQLSSELNVQAESGCWIVDNFVFLNSDGDVAVKLNAGFEIINRVDPGCTIVGYSHHGEKIVFADSMAQVYTLHIDGPLMKWIELVQEGRVEEASSLVKSIPQELNSKIIKILRQLGKLDLALEVAIDPVDKFELALLTRNIDLVKRLFDSEKVEKTAERYKLVGDLALEMGSIGVAVEYYKKCHDYHGLLLIGSMMGYQSLLDWVIDICLQERKYNIAFVAAWASGNNDKIIECLLCDNKYGQAALFARLYHPEQVSRVVQLWQLNMNRKTATAPVIAEPDKYPECFLQYETSLKNFQIIQDHKSQIIAESKVSKSDGVQIDIKNLLSVDFSSSEYNQNPENISNLFKRSLILNCPSVDSSNLSTKLDLDASTPVLADLSVNVDRTQNITEPPSKNLHDDNVNVRNDSSPTNLNAESNNKDDDAITDVDRANEISSNQLSDLLLMGSETGKQLDTSTESVVDSASKHSD